MEASNFPIKRIVDVPDSSPKQIKLITRLVFYAPPPKSSQALQIFGAPEGDWVPAAKAYHEGLIDLIVTNGGIHERTNGIPEAVLIKKDLATRGVPQSAIMADSTATNTGENAAHFAEILVQQNIEPKAIMFMSVRHHAGRCFLTLRKHFPHSNISAITHGLLFSGLNITADNWTNDPRAMARVYGEYQRILTYFEQGYIADFSSIPDW